MTLLNRLFRKKKEFKAKCAITSEPLENGFGYLLTTSDIVASKKYWDMVMSEPETLSYTISHFKSQSSGTQMRSLIFDKYANVENPWIISDSVIDYFDIDKEVSRKNALQWWSQEGDFQPVNTGPAKTKMEVNEFTKWKNYAILEAARDRVMQKAV